jgi:hypothetical protein
VGKFLGTELLTDEEKKKSSHDLSDILLGCLYHEEYVCGAKDFIWEFDNKYGNCYTFNHDKARVKETLFTGPHYGLKLKLYVNYYEKLVHYVYNLGAIIRIGNRLVFNVLFR